MTASTRSIDSPYSIWTSQGTSVRWSVRLMTVLRSELLMILKFPLVSSSRVVRMPISRTVPRKPSTIMMSPTSKTFSNTMNRPEIMSSISGCAPRPTMSERIPMPARSVPVSTLKTLSVANMNTSTDRYLMNEPSRLRIALPFLKKVLSQLMNSRSRQPMVMKKKP